MQHTPPTDQQLAEIEARAGAATKGPWGFYDGSNYADVAADLTMTSRSSYSYREKIAQLEDENYWDDPAHEDDDEQRAPEQMAANAAFIAAARTDVPALLAEVHRLRDAVTAIRHLHKDSPIGPCPVCIDADAVAEGRDGLMPYPCPTGRLTGAQDFDPPHMRAATPAANRCGATHHRYPETACTEPAGHYQPDRDSHAGPLVLGGREAGAAVWDEPAAAAVSSAAENGGQP